MSGNTKKKVLILGAGLSGLTAAYELTKRGFDVQVLERESIPGGRLKSWRDKDGDTIEHGLHKWYHQYRNYRKMMEELGIINILLTPRKQDLIRINANTEVLFEFNHKWPSPLNFTGFFFKKLDNYSLPTKLFSSLAVLAGCTFDRDNDYMDLFDNWSMADFCRFFKMDKRIQNEIIEPLVVYMHAIRLNKASFASTMDGVLFSVWANRNAFKIQGIKGGPGELIIEPMIKKVEGLGGTVRLNSPVKRLVHSNNQVRGVETTGGERLEADYVLSTLDIAGLQEVIRNSDLPDPIFQKVLELEPITIWVARIWFDGKLPITTQLVADFKLAFLVYNLSTFQKEFAKPGQTVLEVIMPDVTAYEHLSDDEIREVLMKELSELFPDTKSAKVNKYVFNKWKRSYTPHSVGSYKRFLPRKTRFQNLFFSGDWIRCPEHSAIYQEKAVVTALYAANEILALEKKPAIDILPPYPNDWTIDLTQKIGRLAKHPIRMFERLRGGAFGL